MIQPRSVSQKSTSSRSPPVTVVRQSAWNPTSSAILARKPPCTCTAPFGLPVVPLVYATNNGCSLSTVTASQRASAWPAHSSASVTSRSGCIGTSSRPRRGTTTTVCTVGTCATAASAVSFIGTVLPRRVKPSAVTTATASASASRTATASAAYPEKIGRKIAPSFATANNAATVSGVI